MRKPTVPLEKNCSTQDKFVILYVKIIKKKVCGFLLLGTHFCEVGSWEVPQSCFNSGVHIIFVTTK